MVTTCPYCKMTSDALEIRTDDHGVRYVVCPHCQKSTYAVELLIEQGTTVGLEKEWDIPFERHRANFKSWYVDVLEGMYANQNSGIAVFIITLPLLERYLRLKSGMTPKDDVSAKREFRENLGAMFPALRDDQTALNFWTVFRHGFLHQTTLSLETRKGLDLPIGRLTHHPVQDSVRVETDGSFTVNPVSYSRTVVSVIEGDFVTFVGKDSDAPPLPKVHKYSVPNGQSIIVSTSSRQ